ncbi:phage major capsid protein, partial [Pseudomonas sp.]|uniref:phage major capsid protein n=1 Tax=Pseudomonas sp. TaxID=306 RepID=UPI001DF7B5F9
MDFEAQVKELNASLKGIGDQIKSQAEATEKQIKASGEMNTETRAKVDELLTKQGELQARLGEAEQKLVNASRDRNHQEELQKSVGALVIESEEMKDMTSSFRGSRRVSVPRAAITTATGGDLVQTQRLPGIIAPAQRRLTVRDLVAPGTTESNSIEYVRETGFTNNARTVA